MRITIRLYAILMILAIFLLTACDRPASGADELRLQGLERSTITPLPLPSTTAQSTVVVTHEVEVTTIVEVVVTATPEPTSTPDPFAPPTEVAMVVDPFVEQGLEFFTEEELGQAQLPFDNTAEPGFEDPFIEDPFVEDPFFQEQPLDGSYITATYWILETTYEVQTMTATALGPVQQIPTITPTPDGSFFPTTMPEVTWTPTPMVSFGDCIHEVRAGENLFRLSLRYGVTVNDIARASGVQNIQLISIGQRLTIPNCGTTGIQPPPITGDGGTGGGNVFPGNVRHVVQQNETLFQISLRYGVTIADIMAVNPNITDPNMILMTSEIVIPVRQ
jgi:LysM repeat protein